MMVIGLTGGLATGKSTVARMFQDCGAHLIDADELARQVVRPGRPAWRDIVRTFGAQVLAPDRTVDRAALARLVFRNSTTLRRLNAIVHPRVAREQAKLTKAIAKKDPRAIIVYDVPLLFEAGAARRVDKIVVVKTDRETQIRRLIARNGFTRAEALRRIRAQMPLAKKARLADYVIDGTLPLPRLRAAVRTIFQTLIARS